MIWALALCVAAVSNIVLGQRTCYDAQECANRNFGSNYTLLQCLGFQSCSNLTNTIVSNSVKCYGAQSCVNITDPYLQVGTLECHSYESCMKSKIRTDGDMECWGEKSCFETSVSIEKNLNDDDSIIYNNIDCSGPLACAKSTFTVKLFDNSSIASFDGYDPFSFYNSTINSTYGGLNLDLYGYYAGWNLTVICGLNSSYPCNVNCYGTGCYNSKILCINDNYCNVYCNESASDLCPLNITYNDDASATSHENSILSGDYTVTYENNHNVSVTLKNVELTNNENYCINSSLSDIFFDYCDDYLECYNSTYIDNNNKSICCHGSQSCEYSTLRTQSETLLNSANQINALVRCDGELACEAATVVINNTIDCGGYHSCQLAGLDTAGEIKCNGRYSCLKSSIADASSLTCNSYYSCYTADIQRVPMVYGYGFRAFDEATIRSSDTENMTLSVYMCSHYAGYGANLCCYAGDTCNVYCSSEGACKNMQISTDDECGKGSLNFIYNSTIAAQQCQVYLAQETMGNFSMNFSYSSTSTMMMTSTMSSSNAISTTAATLGANQTRAEAGAASTTNGGSDDGNGSSSSANSSNKTIEIVLIVVVTLIVVAVSVGLVLYFMKNRNMKRGVSEEQTYKLLDSNKE